MTEQYTGAWRIARTVVDLDRATEITCEGSARLHSIGGTLVYDEAVSFELAGRLMRATRAYRFVSSDSRIVASFNDGSPFFCLRLTADGRGTAVHRCGEDMYVLNLTLCELATWQTQWYICGTKRMRIVTSYTR